MKKKNKDELLEQIKYLKKVDVKAFERKEFKMSDFFHNLNINDCRMKLKAELSMVPTIRMNFKNNTKYKMQNYQCPDCDAAGLPGIPDTQEHCLTTTCVANSDLRSGKDFSKDEELCLFFRQLIDRRMESYGG